jgi:hypothetical protein
VVDEGLCGFKAEEEEEVEEEAVQGGGLEFVSLRY